MKDTLICITGPTASGKTSLAIALAQYYQTQIISADSMQIYRGMDIGTAKPSLEEQAQVVHHMIDVIDTEESFSVARYVELADDCVQKMLSQQMIPIVAGGTGLYLDALIEGNIFPGQESDTAIRQRYERMAQQEGNQAVHACLERVDPIGAARLHPNNLKRVIRALEVFEQTGMTLDTFNQKNKRIEPKYRAIKIGLCPDNRETLYARIDERVDKMVQAGLLDEVKRLFQAGKLVGTAAQAIGYKELTSYFVGECSLEESIACIKQRSRNYAKRQLTWIKRDKNVHWISYQSQTDFQEVFQRSTDYISAMGIQ